MTKHADGLPVKVAQQLMQRIIRRELPPGSVLPSERELQDLYSVSRPVAREAIKLLAARGIVMIHPRQGATVSLDLTTPAIEAMQLAFHHANVVTEDLLDVRTAIEPYIAALAAQHCTAPQVRELSRMRDELEAALAASTMDDAAPLVDYWNEGDLRFHLQLADMSQNPVFRVLTEIIFGVLWKQRGGTDAPLTPELVIRAAQEHRQIIDAVVARDRERASHAMITHLQSTHEHVTMLQSLLQKPVRVGAE